MGFHHQENLAGILSVSLLPLYIFGFAISLRTFTWITNSALFTFCNIELVMEVFVYLFNGFVMHYYH